MRPKMLVVIYSPDSVWLDDMAYRLQVSATAVRVAKATTRDQAEEELRNPGVRCVVFGRLDRETGGWAWIRTLDLSEPSAPSLEVIPRGQGGLGSPARRWIYDGEFAALRWGVLQLSARKRGPKKQVKSTPDEIYAPSDLRHSLHEVCA